MGEGKFFENIYSAGEKEEERVEIEIPEEELEVLKIIAKRIGGDFRMEIKIGEPGQGSFFDSEKCLIIFDPCHIKDNPQKAKFVAGHEGAHRAISASPRKIGLTEEEVNKFYSQIGFAFLQNVVEDPAVNDWMRQRFPGLNEYVKKTYDNQLEKENAVLCTPEIQRIADLLGYWPKFAQYGSEVIRNWHQKRFSANLDTAVRLALERTIRYAEESIATIPDPTKISQDEREVIDRARKRFTNNTNWIWPEVKKLVEMDLHTEEQRQMMKELRQKQKELEQKRKELEQAKVQGDQQRQEKLQEEIEGLEKELAPFNELPEDVKKELQEKIDKAIREAAEKLNREIGEKEKEIEEAIRRQEELEKELEELEEKIKGTIGEEKKELEKKLQKIKEEKLAEEMKQKQAEEELKNIQEASKKLRSEEEMPYPEDTLSEKTKQELEKLQRRLPGWKQKELREKAEKKLEDLEDEMNQGMQGKLNEDLPESHRERRIREEAEKRTEEERRRAEKATKELEKKLEKLRQERRTEYDRVYAQVVDIIDSLYLRLKKFFLPERHPKWQRGYSSGSRLDLEQAMQAEADQRHLERIWERKTMPHKFDYRFSILVDTSGSMAGEKIEETFKGMVVLAEVLEKLGIQYEIIAFSDGYHIFKQWREKLDKEKRDYLSEIKTFGGEGTNTAEATTIAYQKFLENLGKDNFLLTLTDGLPNDPDYLKQILEKIREEGKIKLVGIGLGPDTESVGVFYKAFFSIPKIRVTNEERLQGEKDFVEAFANLLEDMIKYPERY